MISTPQQEPLFVEAGSQLAAAPAPAPRATMPTGASTNTESDGIFGWYRYIQDFTGDFALTWLRSIAQQGELVWEPFAGSGTTLVAAKMLGLDSIGYDLNPFMVDVARVKVDWTLSPAELQEGLDRVLLGLSSSRESEPVTAIKGGWKEYDEDGAAEAAVYPADKKLQRWISPVVLTRFQGLLKAIEGAPPTTQPFLQLAAASTIIPASNMAFRPNICYEGKPTLDYPVVAAFEDRATQMIKDYEAVAGTNDIRAKVEMGDARTDGPPGAQVIFTSPPYPNDMEYVHQTRLELALLSYVSSHRDLTTIKKQMLSSSVKLVYRENEWQKTAGLEVKSVEEVYGRIAKTLEGRNWGWNAADMAAQFFGGMRSVLENWHSRLDPGSVAAVVIGDSAFNGIKVCTDTLLVDTARHHGFECDGIEVFRSRWNTKHDIELRESVVLLRKVGSRP